MTRDEQALLVGLGAVGVVGLAAYLLGRDEPAFGAFIAPPEMRVAQLQREIDKLTAKLVASGAVQNPDESWDLSQMNASEGHRLLKALDALRASLHREKARIPPPMRHAKHPEGTPEEIAREKARLIEERAQVAEQEKHLRGHKKFWQRMMEQLQAKQQAKTGFKKSAWEHFTKKIALPPSPDDLVRWFKHAEAGEMPPDMRAWLETQESMSAWFGEQEQQRAQKKKVPFKGAMAPDEAAFVKDILQEAYRDVTRTRKKLSASGEFAQREAEKKAERLAELQRQEEELRPERIMPLDVSAFASYSRGEDPETLRLQWEALRKLRDPDFDFPDEPVWDAALEALRSKGLMVERPDPKKPGYVIYDLSREAKRIFGKPVRSRCMLFVPVPSLPVEVRKAYRDRGILHTICGTRSFFTEDGREALSIQSLRPGSPGEEPLLVTERWSKQVDGSWKLQDDRAQHVSPADLRAAAESSSTTAEAMRYMIKPPPPDTEAQQVAKAEEDIRRHEENLRQEVDRYLETIGMNVLPPKRATAEEIRRRERVRVRGGGIAPKAVLDERVNEDFIAPGGGTVRIRFYEDERSLVHQILHKFPPKRASMEDVARQLHVIGAEFARTPDGKPGYEGVYKSSGQVIVKASPARKEAKKAEALAVARAEIDALEKQHREILSREPKHPIEVTLRDEDKKRVEERLRYLKLPR